ncbi:hypothetical protein [Sphingomonas sp. NBWT7]|nr:hypothetical protein [Sphingomonas sp. NBWT7]
MLKDRIAELMTPPIIDTFEPANIDGDAAQGFAQLRDQLGERAVEFTTV